MREKLSFFSAFIRLFSVLFCAPAHHMGKLPFAESGMKQIRFNMAFFVRYSFDMTLLDTLNIYTMAYDTHMAFRAILLIIHLDYVDVLSKIVMIHINTHIQEKSFNRDERDRETECHCLDERVCVCSCSYYELKPYAVCYTRCFSGKLWAAFFFAFAYIRVSE